MSVPRDQSATPAISTLAPPILQDASENQPYSCDAEHQAI